MHSMENTTNCHVTEIRTSVQNWVEEGLLTGIMKPLDIGMSEGLKVCSHALFPGSSPRQTAQRPPIKCAPHVQPYN